MYQCLLASQICNANQNCQSRFVVAREKANDVSTIKRSQARNDRIANQAAQRQSAEEFFPRVLQSACGDQERNKRKWRSQQSKNPGRAKAPPFQSFVKPPSSSIPSASAPRPPTPLFVPT